MRLEKLSANACSFASYLSLEMGSLIACNIAISDDQPSVYWPEYVKRFDDEELLKMCNWHALPDDWWTMSYGEFLTSRRPLIAGVIRVGYKTLTESGT